MNIKSLAVVAGLSAGSAIALTTTAAQAGTLSGGGITGEILGYQCPTSTCVDLSAAGYTVSGGSILAPAVDINGEAKTPGTDTADEPSPIDDSDKVTSYNVTSSKSEPGGNANTPIHVTDLEGEFSLFWGSVDSYNLIEFLKDGSSISGASFTGNDVAQAAGITDTKNNYRFDAFISFEGDFDEVKLSSTGAAFEVAAAVPEPASLLGLAGVGLFGGVTLLKRKQVQAS